MSRWQAEPRDLRGRGDALEQVQGPGGMGRHSGAGEGNWAEDREMPWGRCRDGGDGEMPWGRCRDLGGMGSYPGVGVEGFTDAVLGKKKLHLKISKRKYCRPGVPG